jgi:hypothetical protein
VLIAYWPGVSWSPFMAMHIEQPASRHSAPAALKISARPSFSACFFTSWEPGTTITRTPVGDPAALEDRGGQAQVADPAVGARADEHDVDLLAEDRLAGPEVHVLEGVLERAAGGRIGLVLRGGHPAADRDAHARVRAVGDHRLQGSRRRS